MLYFYILIIVQIVAESLPISSSSHLQLLELGVCSIPASSSLIYALHIPTACVFTLFFFREWFFMVRHVRVCAPIILKLCLLGAIVDVITTFFFVAFHYVPVALPLGVGLCITAAALYSLRFSTTRTNSFGYTQALMLGIAQGLALLPGISRFALVYTTARWLGINHRRAFEITWLVEFPLIIAASFLSLYLDGGCQIRMLLTDPLTFCVMVAASLGAYLALYYMERLAARNYLWLLSFYMLMPLAVWLYLSR
jgi:undecaprenyl-diphosphatase